MESSSVTATQLESHPARLSPIPHVTAVDAASIVPVVATPPDPAAIPIDPPHGSPPPPPGQLLPDVAAAEEGSPMKVSTPPPSTPSPVTVAPVPADAYPTEQPTPSENTNAMEDGFGAGDLIGAESDFKSEDPMFGDAVFSTEADGDLVMNDDHPNGFSPNGIQTTSSPHVIYPNSPGSLAANGYAQQENGDIDGPPPAKRIKLDSPGPNGVTEDSPGYGLSMESPIAPTAPWARPMTQPQNKFALSVVRALKKNKDAAPFLVPVDPVALNIPHYPTIITNPMDLSTVEKKLGGGLKTDGAQYQRYANVEEFVHDVRLVVANCATFNGPEHPVTQMAKRLEEAFDKQMKNMPTADDVKPPQMKPVVKKVAPVRRASTAAGPAPRREDSYSAARPKREIPPPREHHPEQPRRPTNTKKRFPKRNDGTAEQLRFCHKLVNELYRPKYSAFAYPFYEPVDTVKLDIPHYHKIVKKPMDMATMLTKLNNADYPDARAFHADFKLMIKNCFAFNPAGTPVHQAGIELNEVFDEKWNGLPSLYGDTEDEGAEEDDSENEQTNAVMLMEAQIQSLHNALNQIKKQASKKSTKEKPAKASTSSVPKAPKVPSAKPNHAAGAAFKKKKKASHDDDEALTFDQKKQLSETIQTLDGGRLEKVLEIIDEVYPEIRETSEEIELDIDSLPSHVLIRLYNFVIRPNKPRVGRPPNGTSSSKAAAGSSIDRKRKSMNEDEESAKIRQLEETLARLKSGQQTAADMALAQNSLAGGGDDSGDSDSDSSNSSGSDSE